VKISTRFSRIACTSSSCVGEGLSADGAVGGVGTGEEFSSTVGFAKANVQTTTDAANIRALPNTSFLMMPHQGAQQPMQQVNSGAVTVFSSRPRLLRHEFSRPGVECF
jgi:hypothetical protein